MRILLIGEICLDFTSPPLLQSFLSTFSYRSTFNERLIAAVTPNKHVVEILEKNREINFNSNHDLVHIVFGTSAAPNAYRVADGFREKGKTIVLSGNHPSALPEEARQHADAVVVGDILTVWPRVVMDAEKNKLQPFYKSFSFKNKPVLPSAKNIVFFSKKEKRVRFVNAVEATRGCPDKCVFCQYSNIPGGSTFYTRPVEDVLEEISLTKEKLLYFKDLSMTINPVYTKKLFKGLKELNKRFICHGNVNVLARDEELVRLAYEAGCIEWTIGFETFSQTTLNSVHKNSNKVEEYKLVVDRLHKYDMSVVGTFVFGFDNDTPDVFEKTLMNIEKLGLDGAIFAVLTPYPGTPLFKKLNEEGRILTRDWSKYNRKDVVFEPKNMTKEELENGLSFVTDEFNSLGKVVYRILKGFKLGFYPAFAVLAGNLGSIRVGRRKN